jgi:hypothetical protein
VLASDAKFGHVPVVLLCRQPPDRRIPSHNVVAQLAKPVPIDELTDLVKKHARSSTRNRSRGDATSGVRSG